MKSHKNQPYYHRLSILYVFILLTIFISFPNKTSAQLMLSGITDAASCNALNSSPNTYPSTIGCGGGGDSFVGSLGNGTPTTGPNGEPYVYQTNGTPELNACSTGFANAVCSWSCDQVVAPATRYYSYSWDGSTCWAYQNGVLATSQCGTSAGTITCTAYPGPAPADALCDPVRCNSFDSVCWVNYECSAVTTVYDFMGRPYRTSQCNPDGPVDLSVCTMPSGSTEICAGVPYFDGATTRDGWNDNRDNDGDSLIDQADPDCSGIFTLNITPSNQNVARGNSVSYLVTPIATANSLIPGAVSSYYGSQNSLTYRDIGASITCDPGYRCVISGGYLGGSASRFNFSSSSYTPLILTITTDSGTPLGLYNFTVNGAPVYVDSVPKNASANASLNVLTPAATSVSLTANPISIPHNNSSILTWNISGMSPITCTGTNMPAGNWSTGGSNNTGVPTGPLTSNTTYTLSCSGPTGLSSDSKTVAVASAPVNGSCGTANKVYTYNVSSYGVDTLCSSGTANPASPAFPAQGGPAIPWSCVGSGTGHTDASCSSNRNIPPVTLSVNVVTSGQGTVTSTSNPAQTNINCGALCVATYEVGTQVTLTAVPSSPSRIFIGWSGDCAGTNPTCTLTVNSAKSVTARFGINPNFKEF